MTPPTASSPVPAILMMLLGVSILPISDAAAKFLAASLPLLQVAWARYFFHLVATLPFILARHGLRALWPPSPWLQLLRGALLLCSTTCFYAGLRYLPLADCVAVLFVAPLFVTVVAPFVLGEKVGIRRYLAAAVGFAGALVIIRPGGETTGWAALFPLVSGFCYGSYILATRKLAGSAPAAVTLAYTALIGAGALSLALPVVWQAPTIEQIFIMLVLGPWAAIGHYLLISAHERAPASLLAPFQYWQIVVSVGLGFLLFGDFPDRWTAIGATIVILSGIYVTLREQKLARERQRAAAQARAGAV
ncbi:MAG: DMT family transporter [Rhodospirillales bacterium]|nr:DMT family transporter [Rhodospirillales bacterium]